MKRLLIHIILVGLLIIATVSFTYSQEPYYSQYYNMPTYYNPAMTGLNTGLYLRMMYRNQWPQYSDDLKSYGFSADVAERFMPGAGGIGLIFDTNKEGQGFIKRTMVGAQSSVRIKIRRHLISQFGFTLAYVQKQVNAGDFIWSDQLDDKHGLLYPNSSFAGLTEKKISYPDITLGLVLNYEKKNLRSNYGFAIHHVTKPNESFSNLEIKLSRKYIVHTDFVISQISNPKKGFKFNPGVLYEYMTGFHTFTLGANISKSVLYLGIWYRNKQSQIYNYQSLVLLSGINIPMVNKYSRLKLMYSYDISVTQMAGNGGAHEITLRFEFDEIHLFKSKSSFADDYPVIYEPSIF